MTQGRGLAGNQMTDIQLAYQRRGVRNLYMPIVGLMSPSVVKEKPGHVQNVNLSTLCCGYSAWLWKTVADEERRPDIPWTSDSRYDCRCDEC
jgi:hypothetical protein